VHAYEGPLVTLASSLEVRLPTWIPLVMDGQAAGANDGINETTAG
jgi:hypothetical protein